MEVLRLYEDDAGESRFDTYDISMQLKDFAPPADPLYVSEAESATRYVMIRLPAGWGGARHPTPRRQILFCLGGRVARDREQRRGTPGCRRRRMANGRHNG